MQPVTAKTKLQIHFTISIFPISLAYMLQLVSLLCQVFVDMSETYRETCTDVVQRRTENP